MLGTRAELLPFIYYAESDSQQMEAAATLSPPRMIWQWGKYQMHASHGQINQKLVASLNPLSPSLQLNKRLNQFRVSEN
jgi:hypothetical protein